jgi:hypothetical protein
MLSLSSAQYAFLLGPNLLIAAAPLTVATLASAGGSLLVEGHPENPSYGPWILPLRILTPLLGLAALSTGLAGSIETQKAYSHINNWGNCTQPGTNNKRSFNIVSGFSWTAQAISLTSLSAWVGYTIANAHWLARHAGTDAQPTNVVTK